MPEENEHILFPTSCTVPFSNPGLTCSTSRDNPEKTPSSKISKQLHPLFRLYFFVLFLAESYMLLKTDKKNIHFFKSSPLCVCVFKQRIFTEITDIFVPYCNKYDPHKLWSDWVRFSSKHFMLVFFLSTVTAWTFVRHLQMSAH